MNDFSYEILDLLKKYENDTNAALAGETCPQCLYAFSPLRENLFEWVEFEPNSRVLEIGSDYGAVTGILAKQAGQVVVLDPRDENLEVNRIRHGSLGNIRYVSGDLLHAASAIPGTGFKEYRPKTDDGKTAEDLMKTPFDYVVIGSFLGLPSKEEAVRLLRAAADLVKPGGTLFAAAENELGVRYWMGAERLTPSFLEVEFRELFETLRAEHGGSFTMYYPVPDYRYPVTVYSDLYLPQTGDVTNISARLDGPGFWFGSEEEAMTKACRNGSFTKFANSFLGVWEKGKL